MRSPRGPSTGLPAPQAPGKAGLHKAEFQAAGEGGLPARGFPPAICALPETIASLGPHAAPGGRQGRSGSHARV